MASVKVTLEQMSEIGNNSHLKLKKVTPKHQFLADLMRKTRQIPLNTHIEFFNSIFTGETFEARQRKIRAVKIEKMEIWLENE